MQDSILMRRLIFREINALHLEALMKFRSSTGCLMEFPALHRELFPAE